MKILVCLAALFILSTAAPGAWEDDPGYRAYLAMIYGPYAETAARGRNGFGGNRVGTSGTGASNCDREELNKNDVISQKFMDDHICLLRYYPPSDLVAFCREFRPSQPLYQVMLLSPNGIKQLRIDLLGHQKDFYNDRFLFSPLHPVPSQIHYTTDQYYNFIYCEQSQGTWIAKQKSGRYQQYVPRGKVDNPEGIYQIYHGCAPVGEEYPGFRHPGSC